MAERDFKIEEAIKMLEIAYEAESEDHISWTLSDGLIIWLMII